MINWPERFDPKSAPVYAHNELEMSVTPKQVWPWLIRAKLWPTWYSNSRDVVIEGGGESLALGTTFRWKTFGARPLSKVTEFVPNERISWTGKATGIDIYHAWLIEPKPTGCHVTSDETQHGFLARLSNSLRPGNMERYHQVWLENLEVKAKGGPPS